MKITRRLGFTLALSIGALIGLFTLPGGGAAAGNPYLVNNHPGATTILNCGWHSDCTGGSDGNYLDWRNYGTNPVYWRSLSWNGESRSVAGSVKVTDGSSGSGFDKCNRSYVTFRTPLGTNYGDIRNSRTAPYNVNQTHNVASGIWPQSTEWRVGTTVHNDCPQNYPAHLHQGQYGSYWAKSSYYPTRAGCSTSECQVYGSVWNNYQHRLQWVGHY